MRTSGRVWRDAPIPDDKVLAPGVIDTSTNYIEHPELVAQRLRQFTDDRRPRSRDRRDRLRLRHLGRLRPDRSRHLLGQVALAREGAALAERAGVGLTMSRHEPSGPVTTSRRGSFWITGERAPGPLGTVMRGPMYVEWESPAEPGPGPPWVLVHGGGGRGTDYLTTPDGRLGWSRLLVQQGQRQKGQRRRVRAQEQQLRRLRLGL